MAQLGWSTPKTAIGYVRKSRITSYQMSMFLSNCQRQNKDIESCLALVRPANVRQDRTVGSSSKSRSTKASVLPVSGRNRDGALSVENLVPVVDTKLADSFAGHLAAAKSSTFVPRNLEQKKKEAERKRLLDRISGRVSPFRQPTVEAVDREIVRFEGDAGADEDLTVEVEGVGFSSADRVPVVGDRSSDSLDPRVSNILSHLRQQGDLHRGEFHLHLHFGK